MPFPSPPYGSACSLAFPLRKSSLNRIILHLVFIDILDYCDSRTNTSPCCTPLSTRRCDLSGSRSRAWTCIINCCIIPCSAAISDFNSVPRSAACSSIFICLSLPPSVLVYTQRVVCSDAFDLANAAHSNISERSYSFDEFLLLTKQRILTMSTRRNGKSIARMAIIIIICQINWMIEPMDNPGESPTLPVLRTQTDILPAWEVSDDAQTTRLLPSCW
jgi:hypothetical protein